MSKFKHPVYVTEEQMCDQIESTWWQLFAFERKNFLREFKIGHIRIDFFELRRHNIAIFEVKKTADYDSIRQICFYKQVVEKYLLKTAPDRSFHKASKDPDVNMTLIAKSIDTDIRDICELLGIEVYRADFDKKGVIQEMIPVFDLDDAHFLEVPEDKKFENLLIRKYGGSGV